MIPMAPNRRPPLSCRPQRQGPPRKNGPSRRWAALCLAAFAAAGSLGSAAAAQGTGDGSWARRALSIRSVEVPLIFGSSALGQSVSPDIFVVQRRQMVSQQIRKRGIHEERLLDAMNSVPRHEFVPPEYRARAYEDQPVPIDTDTSISQPYIVALMTEALDLDEKETVLEIGTGSGYHTAILSRLARRVYSIEIDSRLASRARRNLSRLGYSNVELRTGDGYQGWPSAAPFDAIILTAAPPRIPQPLIEQLRVGGRMVVSVGEFLQDLIVLEKHEDGSVSQRELAPVRLPEMTGEVQGQRLEEPTARRRGPS